MKIDTMRATSSDGRETRPLAVAAGILVLAALVVPFSGRMGPTIPGAASLWCATVLLCDVFTAALLISRFRNGSDPRQLVLSTAYASSAATVVLLCFALPGVVSASPDFASDASAQGWLYVCRHVVPPAMIALSLAPWPRRLEAVWRGRDRGLTTWAVVGGVVVIGPGLLAAVMLLAPGHLPTAVVPGTQTFRGWVVFVVLTAGVATVAVSTWGVIRRGATTGLEAWAVVATVAWLGDAGLTFLHEDRYTIAYYGARLLGISASLLVLVAMLGETFRLHHRVMAGTADLEDQVTGLLEAARQRDDIVAVVTHEMRSPLAGLQGYLEVMVEDEVDPATLDRMHRRSWVLARRLSLLSEDLLAAATMQHGDLVVIPENLDVTEQVDECLAGFPGLDIRVSCQPGLHILADPLRLQQILANLVRNAQKHGAEPVQLDITQDGPWVTFRVSDAGPGVNQMFVPHLFERFTRDSTVSSPGAGLGLSVVRELVNAHGGGVGYEVTGSSFFFSLPSAPPRASSAVAPAEAQPVGF